MWGVHARVAGGLPLPPAFVPKTRIIWLYKREEVSFGERWAIKGGTFPQGLDSIPLLFPAILPSPALSLSLSLYVAYVHAHKVLRTTGVDLRALLLPAYTFN